MYQLETLTLGVTLGDGALKQMLVNLTKFPEVGRKEGDSLRI